MNTSNEHNPTISVVIPVKNEAAGLAACLEGILGQSLTVLEIIVIDSGSSDGTQEIARQFERVSLVEIASHEFNHGDTRNLGVQHARGEFVVFTVGDACPVSSNWLSELMAGFVCDDVIAVSGLQVVRHCKSTNPLDWFCPQNEPDIRVFHFDNEDAFLSADPGTKKTACAWDNVTAAYRRSALDELPFRCVVYGEDVFFAVDALAAGHTIAYNPRARVYHFHLENYETVLKRTIAVASLRYKVLGFATPPYSFFSATTRAVARLVREPELSWGERWTWIRYNVAINRALRDGLARFNVARLRGGDAVHALHERYCGTPPVPLKGGQT